MVRSAIAFFILAIVAFIFGAYGIAGLSMDIGKLLLGIFLVISIISIITAIVTGGIASRRH